VVVTSLALVVGLLKLVTTFGRPYFHYGDQAVLASRVADAMRFHVELGPYSRFGWSHPGPALFYLLAPIYSVSGSNPRSLFFGSLLINGICIVGAVWVVRRFAGEWSARWTAAVVGVALLALGPDAIETFWNPDLEAAAILLVLVLTAAAIAGSGPSVVGVAVVGSYVVQTDVGTTPLIGAMAVVSVIGYLIQVLMRRGRGGKVDRPPGRLAAATLAVIGVVVAGVAWIPPLVQQFRGRPGNLSALYDFFTSPASEAKYGSTHTLSAAWAVVANSTTTVPWGNVSSTATMTTASAGRQWTVVVWAGLAVVGMVWAGWRRRWFGFGLSLTVLAGLAVSVFSAERIVGPIGNYLGFWMELLPVPAVVAIGVLTVDGLQHRAARPASPIEVPASTPARHSHARIRAETSPAWWRVVLGWAVALVLVLPVAGVAWQLGRGSGLVDSDGNLEIPQLAGFTVAHLKQTSQTNVLVFIGTADRWPEASGLVLQLSYEGYHPTVTANWGFMFTPRYVAGSAPQAEVVLADGTPGPSGTSPPATPLSQTFSHGDVPTTITFVPAAWASAAPAG
jgi:hypothetical protein